MIVFFYVFVFLCLFCGGGLSLYCIVFGIIIDFLFVMCVSLFVIIFFARRFSSSSSFGVSASR